MLQQPQSSKNEQTILLRVPADDLTELFRLIEAYDAFIKRALPHEYEYNPEVGDLRESKKKLLGE